MTVKYIGEGSINNGLFSKLIASYTLTPTYFLDSAVTVDATGNTFTITGYTPTAGDKFLFWITANLYNTNPIPAPLSPGFVYYVVNPIGSSFQLASTSGGTALDITGTGTAGKWRMERPTNISSITINNLPNLKSAKIVLKNGGWNSDFGALNFRINNVSDSDGYYYAQGSGTGTGNGLYLNSTGTNNVHRVSAMLDVICNNNIANTVINITQTNYSNTATSASFGSNFATGHGCSKNDSRFNSMNSINFYIGGTSNFFGDLTMEVYAI